MGLLKISNALSEYVPLNNLKIVRTNCFSSLKVERNDEKMLTSRGNVHGQDEPSFLVEREERTPSNDLRGITHLRVAVAGIVVRAGASQKVTCIIIIVVVIFNFLWLWHHNNARNLEVTLPGEHLR